MPMWLQLLGCFVFAAGGAIGFFLGMLKGHDVGMKDAKEIYQVEEERKKKFEQMYRSETVKDTLGAMRADHESANHICTRFCPANPQFDWFKK